MQKEIVRELIDKGASPAYIFDLDILKERVREIKSRLEPQAVVCYAMKANPFLLDALKGEISSFEVCSPGEFAICEQRGIAMKDIVLSGVNKEYKEIERVVNTYKGEGVYTAESPLHFAILKDIAQKSGRRLQVLLRLSSKNQFGMDKETILSLLKSWQGEELIFHGIQYYSGTQKKGPKKQAKELALLDDFIDTIKEETGLCVPLLEYGPGFYIPYFEGEEEVDEGRLLDEFRQLLSSMRFDGKIVLEMGRYIAAFCGYYLTRIIDTKTSYDNHYCIVDGGINHVNYYGQSMAMKVPFISHFKGKLSLPLSLEKEQADSWCICGSLCTVGDVVVRQYQNPHLSLGDYLLFERLGAYSVTEGIYLFLSRDLPKVYSYSQKEGLCLYREGMATYPLNTNMSTQV